MACHCGKKDGCEFQKFCFQEIPKPPEYSIGSKPPPYLPQPEDNLLGQTEPSAEAMVSIEPWATGRVDWSPLGKLTGTRPVVDSYSITRFSPLEWRKANQEILNRVKNNENHYYEVDKSVKCSMERATQELDKSQRDNTELVQKRSQLVYRWRAEDEALIQYLTEEIMLLMDLILRLRKALSVLQLPEAICSECIQVRTGRLEPDLIRDAVEEELISERALCREIRDLWQRTLQELESQLNTNKEAKRRIEFVFSDKSEAYNIETRNVGLNNKSPQILFKPGAVRLPSEQSTEEQWVCFVEENLAMARAVLRKSQDLREQATYQIITDSCRDLRTQADRVHVAVNNRISETEQCRSRLELELKNILEKIASCEKSCDKLKAIIRQTDFNLKTVQSRLDNRNEQRPRVENCRDATQYGLLEEVRTINKNVASLKANLHETEQTIIALNETRATLERAIIVKRKTISIDDGRVRELRARYPDVTSLSGH